MTWSLVTITADRYANQAYMGDRSRLRYSVQGTLGLAGAFEASMPFRRHIDLIDEAATVPKLQEVFHRIRSEDDGISRDIVMLISGHGDSNSAKTWFCTFSAKPGTVDIDGERLGELILSSEPNTVLVVMDYCHSGGVANDLFQRLNTKLDAAHILVLAGTGRDQLAYEHPALGLGLFTYSIHEALTERAFFARAPKVELQSPSRNDLTGELSRLFIFARERTEELAYLLAGGKRQSPQIFGAASVALTWSLAAVPPPTAPLSRHALAGRLRRIMGWSTVAAIIVSCLFYFKVYHLTVGPEGWVELRSGPSWMASLLPKDIGGNDQLPITTIQLDEPSPKWSSERILRRAAFMEGAIGGLNNNLVEGREPWIEDLLRELPTAAKDSFDFALGSVQRKGSCAQKNNTDGSENYQSILEENLLDSERACDVGAALNNAIDVSSLFSIENPRTTLDFSILNIPDQTIKSYFSGLSLIYRNSKESADRVRALENAAVLVAYRAESGKPKDSDWLAFLALMEDVSALPRLAKPAHPQLLPSLAHCLKTWCEMEWKIATHFAYKAEFNEEKSSRELMMWLIARHTDKRPSEGESANSWAIPTLLVMARAGELDSQDFDLLIRYFRWIVPEPGNIWIETSWQPAFARVLKFPDSWKTGLWICMTQQLSSHCSNFDSDQAADILGAQSRFLTTTEQSYLVSRIDAKIANVEDVALFASSLADLICSSKVPQRWISSLTNAIRYDIRISPPSEFDPITGTMIITVTDSATAVALAVALEADTSRRELIDPIIRYSANHNNWQDLGPLRRSLDKAFRPLSEVLSAAELSEIQTLLREFRNNAQARSIILEALASNDSLGLLRHPILVSAPSIWKLDASLAVRYKLSRFGFDSNGICQ